MTVRVYLMPRVGTGDSPANGRRAKYSTLTAGQTRTLRYGPELVCLFVADTTETEHAAITANPDVRAFPENLDSLVTAGNRTAIVNALEAANVPAQWVANGQTFRMVLRRLAGIFELLKNVDARGFRFLQQALGNQISTLPANVRNAMQQAAEFLGLDTTGITGSTTLRAALTIIGAQFEQRPILALGITL